MRNHRNTVVIGAGQAGLAASWWLVNRGVDHVVLERGRVAEKWRSQRWDSFTLLSPNWQTRLPGHAYAGPDPNGFMSGAQTGLNAFAPSCYPTVARATGVSWMLGMGRFGSITGLSMGALRSTEGVFSRTLSIALRTSSISLSRMASSNWLWKSEAARLSLPA